MKVPRSFDTIFGEGSGKVFGVAGKLTWKYRSIAAGLIVGATVTGADAGGVTIAAAGSLLIAITLAGLIGVCPAGARASFTLPPFTGLTGSA